MPTLPKFSVPLPETHLFFIWPCNYIGDLIGVLNALVSLNLLKESRKSDKIMRLAKHFIAFSQHNKFKNAGVRILDSIYHMTLKLL